MRSRREIVFRLRQEAANALLAFSSPNLRLTADAPLAILPGGSAVAALLRSTHYARELISIASSILEGRIPVFNSTVDYGKTIAWRRDPMHNIETPPAYFRRIPYLDLARAGDHKFIWEINRHQHLVLLAQAELLTGDAKYGDHVFRQLEHWWRENPFQRGINWTSALEVALRALSWVWIFHWIGTRMSPGFRKRFLAELYRHGLHLEYNLSLYFSPNTHLLGEAVALHALGRLYPQWPRSTRWRRMGHETVREHLHTAVMADGSYFEQSTYYHVYALDMFAFHSVLEDVPSTYIDKLGCMAEFLASLVSDTGKLPFLGDDDGGRLFHPYGSRSQFARGTLAVASLLAEKRYFAYADHDLAEMATWWLSRSLGGAPSLDAIPSASAIFQDAGIVTFRRSGVVALFDAGPFGPGNAGHSHSDTLSLVVTVGAQEVLIDSGTFSYMDPEWRSVFRGTPAHNTICTDTHDQAVSGGPFRWTQKPAVQLLAHHFGAERDFADAACSCQHFTHRRKVEFDGLEFWVHDHLEGPPGEHAVQLYWHFAIEPRLISPGSWSIGDIAVFSAEGGVVETAWRSRCFGSREPAWVIVVRRRAPLPLEFNTRLRILVS